MSKDPGHELSSEPKSDFSGLGIFSFTPSKSRHRALTIEDFSISSVEGSKPSHILSYSESDTPLTSDWETVTWVFSDTLQSISAREKENLPVVLTKAQQLVELVAENPLLKHEIVIENVLSRILFMLYDPKPLLRSMAYRILRHTLAGRDTVAQLVQQKLLLNITISLSTSSPLIEKEEALKFIRAIMDIPEGTSLLSVGVIKALVVLTEHESEDSSPSTLDVKLLKNSCAISSGSSSSLFCKMCLETVCELLLLNPELAYQAGGMRLLINLIISAPPEISTTCILTFVTLLDHSEARYFLRGGSDLDSLFSVFGQFEDDDSVVDGHESAKLYKRAMDIVFFLSVLMKSWTGLLYFCHDNLSGFKLLLMNLKRRNTKLRNIILDLLMDVLRIKTLPWLEGSRLGSVVKRFAAFLESKQIRSSLDFQYSKVLLGTTESNVVAHSQGFFLKIMIDTDIRLLLLDIINDERNEENISKATLLLTNIFEMAVDFLPSEFYQESLLGAVGEPISSNSILKIQLATVALMPKMPQKKKTLIQGSVREITQTHRVNMSDHAFKVLLSNLKTLHLKEFVDWDWSSLLQLFQGPIRNPLRFAEIQEKYPKLLKTFISFLRPFKYRFNQVPLQYSAKYPTLKNPKIIILVASQLFESLLTFEEGSLFLSSNKFMPQLAEIMAQVDPFSGLTASDPILSEYRLKTTLSIGYIKFLGVFSNAARGITVLEQWQLIQLMNDLIDGSAYDEENNHLIFNLLNNLSYSLDSPVRLLLSKALSIANYKVKGYLLDKVVPSLLNKKECEEFVIDNLVTALCDESEDVIARALRLLHELFILRGNVRKIDTLVESQPSVAVLESSEEGRALLLNFCTTSKGFKYLQKNGFIDAEFRKSLIQLRSFEYLDIMENSLRLLFYPYLSLGQQKRPLRHFFYYLLSTEEGSAYFRRHRQYVNNLLKTIRRLSAKLNSTGSDKKTEAPRSPFASSMTLASEYSIESESGREYSEVLIDDEIFAVKNDSAVKNDAALINTKRNLLADEREYELKELKQKMWILGEISSAEYGFQLLDPSYSIFVGERHIAEDIVSMFKTASYWQFRGLAFYVLGMMASTEEGVEILDELNWILVKATTCAQASLAYPANMIDARLFEFGSKYDYDNVLEDGRKMRIAHIVDTDENTPGDSQKFDEKVISLINHLSSILGRIERKAKEELMKLKIEQPLLFCNLSLFLKVIDLLEKGSFKYRLRVFILGLFECFQILGEFVKRKRKNSFFRRS